MTNYEFGDVVLVAFPQSGTPDAETTSGPRRAGYRRCRYRVGAHHRPENARGRATRSLHDVGGERFTACIVGTACQNSLFSQGGYHPASRPSDTTTICRGSWPSGRRYIPSLRDHNALCVLTRSMCV